MMASLSKNQNYSVAHGEGSSTHPALQSLNAAAAQFANVSGAANQQKYTLLVATIEEIGKQVRPAHTGNKNAVEQMKRHIAFAKLLIRELLVQVDHNLGSMNVRDQRRDGGGMGVSGGVNSGINLQSIGGGINMPPRKKANFNQR